MRTHETTSVGVPVWLAVLTLGLPLLLAGCEGNGTPPGAHDIQETGSSQIGSGTDNTGTPESPKSSNTRKDDEKPVVYTWGLPSNDSSVGAEHPFDERPAYDALRQSCLKGAEFLSSYRRGNHRFESPRNVLLFAAGIQLCQGHRAAAAELFEPARALGSAGLAPQAWVFCVLYRVVGSVLEQRPPERFTCAGGAAPPFKSGSGGTDDPLTLSEDESLPKPGTDPTGAPETEKPSPEPDPGSTPEPSPETSTRPSP